jgi:hypothetical protein
MSGDGHQLPIGQKITLAGHFDSPVTLESVRSLAGGYECRVRLPDPLGPSPVMVAIHNHVSKLDHVKREIVAARFFEIPSNAIDACR